MTIKTRTFSALAVGAFMFAGIMSAQAGMQDSTTITVSLWDKGTSAEMSTDLGMDMGGDASKANMGLDISADQVQAGKITFKVVNASKEIVHEMVVFPLADGEKIPYDANEAKINEDTAGHLGEVSELEPGKGGTLTIDLKPGKYILACNIATHFANGMWKVITVTK